MLNISLILTYKLTLTFLNLNEFEVYPSAFIWQFFKILSYLFQISHVKLLLSKPFNCTNGFFPFYLHFHFLQCFFSFFPFLIRFILLTHDNEIPVSYSHPYEILKLQKTFLSMLLFFLSPYSYFHYMILFLYNNRRFFHFFELYFIFNHFLHALYFTYRFIYSFEFGFLDKHSYN